MRRKRLFNLINDLPTITETVEAFINKQNNDKSSGKKRDSNINNKSKPGSKVTNIHPVPFCYKICSSLLTLAIQIYYFNNKQFSSTSFSSVSFSSIFLLKKLKIIKNIDLISLFLHKLEWLRQIPRASKL